MQKLRQRNTYTPLDTQLVQCNCDSELNKDENLSVQSLKTCLNNPEVDQRSTKNQGLQPKVFVISINGKPLMPTKSSRVRKMLLNGKAKCIKRSPFTIKLTFECENKVQEIVLGIDTGYKNIGFSAISKEHELISGTLILDGKTSERLSERKMHRKGRRNKLWYRKPKFMNRTSTKKEGWLPPSTQRRYNTHVSLINKIKKLIPVSQVVIEIAKFNIQKIENPEINEKGYQQGDMYQYQNIRSYLMSREKGLCQLCKKEFSKGDPSHIHHCKQRSNQGSNRPKNLALLHKSCHKELHRQGLKLSYPKEYKASTFMSIINKRFWNDIPNLKVTYGNITFVNRNNLKLEKSHSNDAFVIAKGTTQIRTKSFEIIQKHRNNRILQLNRKGFKPSIRRKRSIISPLDLFWVKNISYICKGMFSYGKYILYGEIRKKEYFRIAEVEKYFNTGSLVWN